MIYDYKGKSPDLSKASFIAESADIAGDVCLGAESSVWFNVSIRGDIAPVEIGERSNVQDNAVIHVGYGVPTKIGRGVTIGHSAVLHACTVGDDSLIGMGAIVLDGAEIGAESVVGAGSLVAQNKKFPPRSLIIGSPARVVRTLPDQAVEDVKKNGEEYIELALHYRREQEKGDGTS
jgi:gamma-carbonic anhydrase